MSFLNKLSLLLVTALLVAVSCSKDNPQEEEKKDEPHYSFEYNVGTIGELPANLSTYQDFCKYVADLDGFLYDERLYTPQFLQLYNALTDYNVPISDAKAVDGKAKIFHHAKNLMDSIIVLDTHCDFPEQLYYHKDEKYTIDEVQSRCQVSTERMKQGHQSAQYLATWIEVDGSQTSEKALADAPATLWGFINLIDNHIKQRSSICGIARNKDEILALKKQGKIAFLYGLENGFWTGTDLSNLNTLVEKGFTYITLSHNGDNQICHSSQSSKNPMAGLTEFGRQYVKRMNELGLVIDLSHTSEGTCREVLQLSKAPVIFSHSGAAGVFQHPRNVSDELLRSLAVNGGVIQVYIVQNFMASENVSKVGLKELVEHINHCVDVAGIDHVGVGIDLDGGGGGKNYNAANDAINLTVALIEEGYSDEDIAKIWGENFLRVLTAAQSMATLK